MNILAIPGSLRANSSTHAILKAVAELVPADIHFDVYPGLGQLPLFNDSLDVPEPVRDFRELLRKADGVFICTPEYAFGVPGVLKNAIDWTVSSGEFVNKPVALITAATGGDKAHASLLLTLTALSAAVPEDGTLLISFVRARLNDKGEMKDPETLKLIEAVLHALVKAVMAQQSEMAEN